MAQKRMFDRAITETEKFADMPMSSKGLYFLLGMAADDEGFVSAKQVLRVHGGSDDDLNILLAKGFCIKFPSGIVVVTDWNENNYLDSRRIKPTQYQEERNQLLTVGRKYVLSNGLARGGEYRIEESTSESGDSRRITTKAKYPHAEEVFQLFPNMTPSWKLNKTYRACAENIFAVRGMKDAAQAMQFALSHKDDPYCPQIHSPYDLDMKWDKLVAYSLKK